MTPRSPVLSPSSALVSFYVFLVLAFLVPLGMAWAIGDTPAFARPFLSWLVIVYSSWRLCLLSLRGEMRLVSLTFWMFVYVWMGVSPFAQLLTGTFSHGGYYSTGTVSLGFAVVLSGLLAYELGIALQRRHGAIGRRLSGILRGRSIAPGRAILIGLGAVSVAALLIFQLGGPGVFIGTRREVFLTLRGISGGEFQERFQVIRNLLLVPPFVAMYLLWWLWLRERKRLNLYMRALLWALLAGAAAINLLISNPVNAARYWVGTIALSLAFVTIPWRRSWSFTVWVGVMVVILLLIFPYADVFRHEMNPSNLYFRGLDPITEKADYDAFQQLLNALIYVDEHGYAYGRQFAGSVLFWVPRKIWTTKPVSSGPVVAEAMGYGHTNLSMPLWGELYVDGGWVAVVLGFVGYGFLVAVLDTALASKPAGDDRLAGCLVPILAAYQFLILRGALMSALAYLAPVVALILVATRRRSEEPTVAREIDRGAA